MCRIALEEFLGIFYDSLIEEYARETNEDHVALYNRYVRHETRAGLENQTVDTFTTYCCYPAGWHVGIQLWVNVIGRISIYFCSASDIRRYAAQLVRDEEFKKLVKVAFYIQQNVKPKG